MVELDARTIPDVILNKTNDSSSNHHQYSVELAERLCTTRAHKIVAEILKQVQDERIHNMPSLQLEVGDEVYLHSPGNYHSKYTQARKFISRFKGPYRVIEKVTPVNYTISKDAKQDTVHRKIKKGS